MSDNDDSRKPSRLGPGEKQWLFWAVGLVALAGVVLYANLPKGPAPPSAVEWASSLDAAKAKAAETNRLLLIDFYATWCGPCQMMDREVYPHKQAAEALANWVAVKVDVDKQPQIARDYQVWGMPTLVALSPQGKEIARVTEGMDLQTFVSWIKQAEENWKKKDSGPTTPASTDKWSDNLDAAKAEAARTNRLLLVDFYATWCGPCQMMDREVYPRKEAAEALADWVACKVNVEEQPKIAREYRIWGMPTLIVLSPQGKEIARITEGMDLQSFVNWIRKAESKWKEQGGQTTSPAS